MFYILFCFIAIFSQIFLHASNKPLPLNRGPDFLIVGSPKCGTTSLFHYLTKHPNIRPGTAKEINFFNKYYSKSHYKKGIEWYLKQFPKKDLEQNFFLTGEATAGYLSSTGAPKEVSQYFPDVKIIILIRNPVDRALSHYKMNVRLNTEMRPYEEVFIEKMISFKNNLGTMWDPYIYEGVYAPFIQAWRKFYPDDQILIICSEELFANPKKVVNHVFNFLGLSPFNLHSYPNMFKGPNNEIKLSPHLRQQMLDFYAPYNEELQILLRDEMHIEMNLLWEE